MVVGLDRARVAPMIEQLTPINRMRSQGWEARTNQQTGDVTWFKRAALGRPGGDWVRGEYGCSWDADLTECSRTPQKPAPVMTEEAISEVIALKAELSRIAEMARDVLRQIEGRHDFDEAHTVMQGVLELADKALEVKL